MRRFSALVLIVFCDSGLAASGIRIIAGPCLQNPTETSMTVVWMTDATSTGWVEYGDGTSLSEKAVASHDGLIDADQRLHRVTITGLKPGSTYRYRVVAKEIVDLQPYSVTYGGTTASDIYDFSVLDPARSSYSFIVLNDLHDKVPIMKKLLAHAAKKPYDFVLLNGDIINDPKSEQHVIDVFLRPAGELFAARIPFFFVRGNHEVRGRHARPLKRYLRNADQDYYYAFSHGPVRFVILDSGEDKPDDHPAYSGLADFDRYRSLQARWLEREVTTTAFRTARYRIALTHIPIVGSAKRHGTIDCGRKWGDLLNKGKLDLYITAHLHRHALLEPAPGVHDYPVVIGGAPAEGRATLIRVDVNPAELNVTIMIDDGTTAHTRRIRLADRDRKSLLEGVSRIGVPTAAGALCVFGDDAIPLVATRSRRGAGAPIVAATRLGGGRAVAFGWTPFTTVFTEYRNAPAGEHPQSDEEKRDQWLLRFSRTVGRNLGPFFQAWGVPTSEKARASITDLPAWMP